MHRKTIASSEGNILAKEKQVELLKSFQQIFADTERQYIEAIVTPQHLVRASSAFHRYATVAMAKT